MKKLVWGVAGFCFLGLVASLSAALDDVPSIGEIMIKAHKARTGLRSKIAREVRKSKPDWDAIQKNTKEFVKLASVLVKNKPPVGSEDSWKKLCASYCKQVKALDEAAASKDRRKVRQMVQRLGRSCQACHDAHQPE